MSKTSSYFSPVDPKVNFVEQEEKILEYWNKNQIFEKSLEKTKNAQKFIFYEGPPTANGKPGIHHVEGRSFKDIIPRYKTMKGFHCERKGGWDCHGLPVEIEVEKKLGISGKPQIENYGIEKFNKLCRESVYEYVEEWEKVTKRLGFWIDLSQPYETMNNDYIESCWWILKEIWNKGWLYEDYKVVPYCTRCGTSLSSHELAMGYKDDVEDPSVYIKFKLKKEENTYLLAWTTTPWTLPGNVALAVDENEEYVKVLVGNESLIFAKKLVKHLGIVGEIVSVFKGKDLAGLEYEPLFDVKYDKKSHYVLLADFVSMEEGTGIVHIAVMYGEEDFKLGTKYDLPKKHVVNERGEFVDEVQNWKGRFVKDVDGEIIKHLTSKGRVFKSETIKHTYPFCWRCSTPLLYYAMTSWYLKTTAVKDDLVKNNQLVNWIPDNIKNGRMGEWLSNNRDWALSRNRYWGTPLPVWRCDSCKYTLVIASVKELSDFVGKDLSGLDLHRPFIDEVKFKCLKCKGTMSRVPFVLDCWFDSGAMPYAQWHYPFENKENFEKHFPADFISEAVDQTRGWFYTLLAVSALLEKGPAYKTSICYGHVLDENGNKMSKSKGNVVDPWTVFNEVGADATRWYFYSVISPGPSFRFSIDLVKNVTKRFILVLWNCYNYFVTYANLRNWRPSSVKIEKRLLDKWILARLNQVVSEVTVSLDNYDIYSATQIIESFVTKDLSQWYIRRSRGETNLAFLNALHQVLVVLSKLLAPFMPFLSEVMYLNLTKEKSVHLADWPKSQTLSEDENSLIIQMNYVREIVEKAHAIRKDAGQPVKQPLSSLASCGPFDFSFDFSDIIKDEVNVKKWTHQKKGGRLEVHLDTTLTKELKAEGEARRIIRLIQDERKRLGTSLDEMVNVSLPDWPKEFEEEIKKKTLAKNISKGNFAVTRL
ncbi:MAG: isoleucine--tRNA ligase [Patescibacteria group bacterium]|nr:isoleucine--tRNA ligase [Patescibacteria group bacterium]